MAHVDSIDECWVWTGTRNRQGYGQFRDGRMVKAHRWIWEYHNGPIPEELELDHLCRIRACVNPAHLEPVTHRDNSRRTMKGLCRRSHPLEGPDADVRVGKGGARVCRACVRITTTAARRRDGVPQRTLASDTHCVAGHPWAPENTYWTRHSSRQCRACANEKMKQAYRANPVIFKERAKRYRRNPAA